MVVVVARIKAKPEFADEVAESFRAMVEWVAENEEDTLTYTCNRSRKDSSEFLFFERYPDQAALQAHSASPRFAQLVGSLAGKLDGTMDVAMLDEVAAKI